jgi:hypothetical protein
MTSSISLLLFLKDFVDAMILRVKLDMDVLLAPHQRSFELASSILDDSLSYTWDDTSVRAHEHTSTECVVFQKTHAYESISLAAEICRIPSP